MHSSKSESLEAENEIGMETGTCGQPRTFRPQLGFCGCGAIHTAAVDASGLGGQNFTVQFGHITGMYSSLLGLYKLCR
jgi:hypothetical protein